jgi:4-hydroxy-4-methyl-2-oxoglutarate aldolase
MKRVDSQVGTGEDDGAGRREPLTRGEIVRWLMEFSTCNLSDALDALDIAGAPQGIHPLYLDCGKAAGRAMTIRLVPGGTDSAVEGTLRAIMAAEPGDLLVIDNGGRLDVNSFGGIAAFTAQRRGLAGVVIDGVTRDLEEMREMTFPAFGKGAIQQSIRGRCAFGGFGGEIRIGGVAVRRGDYVAADENGVVVLPAGRMEEVMENARRCFEREEQIKRWIGAGVDPVEAHQRAGYEGTDGGKER